MVGEMRWMIIPWIRASFIHYEEDAAADSGTNWKLMIGGEKEAEQQFWKKGC